MHLVYAVSAEYGVEGWFTTRDNINSINFCRIFSKIKQQGNNCAVLMDNVSYHHSKVTKKYCEEEGFEIVYNVPQTPDLNAIEKVFLQFKTYYR